MCCKNYSIFLILLCYLPLRVFPFSSTKRRMPLFPWNSTRDLSKQFPGSGARFCSPWWSLFLGSAKMHTGGSCFWKKENQDDLGSLDTREAERVQELWFALYFRSMDLTGRRGEHLTAAWIRPGCTQKWSGMRVPCTRNSDTVVITIFCLSTNLPTKRNGDTHTKHDKQGDWNDCFREST